MTLRSTHTFVELGLSKAAYDEIAKKMRDAEYDHAFMDGGAIDMHGIGVTIQGAECEPPRPELPLIESLRKTLDGLPGTAEAVDALERYALAAKASYEASRRAHDLESEREEAFRVSAQLGVEAEKAKKELLRMLLSEVGLGMDERGQVWTRAELDEQEAHRRASIAATPR